MFGFFARRRANSELLRRAVNSIGPEFEVMPYERLTEPAEVLSLFREFEGAMLSFSAEAYETKANGDLCFCIDARGLETFPYTGPSYHFYKRRDGSVYY